MLSSLLDGMKDFFLADSTVYGLIRTGSTAGAGRMFRVVAPDNVVSPWVVYKLSRAKARERRGASKMGHLCDSVVSFRFCVREAEQDAAAVASLITLVGVFDQALKVASGDPLDGYTGTWGDQRVTRAIWDSDSYDERDDPELGLLVAEMDLLINHAPT